ncbi:MAG: endonuclease Q family protein [Candidatus Bathyarchaeia archaeon]
MKSLKTVNQHVKAWRIQMRVIADLHIHGRFSRATSEQMNIEEIAKYAKIKGLNLVGTGDFTHLLWLQEIRETLASEADTGLFKLAKVDSPVRFMLQTEVCTIFDHGGQSKKVHHVILTPSLETADQINERLAKFGDLKADGRPILDCTAPQLVEEVMAVSGDNMVFPAHAWTPWFSIFGAFSGFNTIKECYQDMTKHIHALETGLSSDPPMNWRLSGLDKYALLSNSDCHSFWPWRIGREANVFDLPDLTYNQVISAISDNDPERFKFTIETDPAYGKYHWTGHRNCKISFSPQEAIKFGNICPVCRRKLTKGVEQRVEELADRPATYKRPDAPGFKRLLPLSEVIAAVVGTDSPSTQAVWKVYNALIGKFGDEYSVLIDVPLDALAAVVDTPFAQAIIKVRDGTAKVTPGYDGVYGQLVLGIDLPKAKPMSPSVPRVQQRSMSDFW